MRRGPTRRPLTVLQLLPALSSGGVERSTIEIAEALVAAGEKRIEVTSFVSPKWIPQLSDAEELLRLVGRKPGVVFSALVPNLKGLQRAREAGFGRPLPGEATAGRFICPWKRRG